MPISNPLVNAYLRDRYIRGHGVTEKQHATAFYQAPCITSTAMAVEYGEITQGIDIHPRMVHRAVKSGILPAYKLGKGYHFKPADLDDWLDSLRVSTS